MQTYDMYIDGQWSPAESRQTYDATNPALGQPFGKIALGDRTDAQRAIAAANRAAGAWAKTSLWERAAWCAKIADVIESRIDELAQILCTEAGKPLHTEARDEAILTAGNFRTAADQAKWLEGSVIPVADAHKRVVSLRQPRGVVAVITPWNFPTLIPSEYIPYAIVMGNAVVWTPAPTAAASAIKLTEMMSSTGLPAGVINLVTGPGASVGDELVVNPGTHAIGMTGSTATGKLISSRCGLKPRLFELGGNGPTIVLEDADPDQAAAAIAPACFYAAGQVCSSAERILVADRLKNDFAQAMVEQSKQWRIGDPRDAQTTMGPQNNMAVVEKVDAHLADATRKGATILAGGQRPNRAGFYYEPTVVTDFAIDSLVNTEETFGPVAPISGFASDQQAWEYINACPLGLVSTVFTRDLDRAWRWGESLRTGITVVNDHSNYWELHLPFGGRSGTDSGIGRIGGRHTLAFMSEIKTIAFHLKDE